MIGLRGGASYQNTYHINAGALKATEPFKKGLVTAYDIFRQEELIKEFGIRDEDIASAVLHSRIYDYVIDKGPTYVFKVNVKVNREQLLNRWRSNLDPDKQEHDSPVFIPNAAADIRLFIKQNYRGVVVSRPRKDEDRYLLHPGALSLASLCGFGIGELASLYQEKEGGW